MTSNLTYTISDRKLDRAAKARSTNFRKPQTKCPVPNLPKFGGWGAKANPGMVAAKASTTKRAKRVKPSMPKMPWETEV
jgi:hypothetical protein